MPNDLISREAAVKAIESVPDGNWKSVRYSNEIKKLPPAEPQWIPCSERMPEQGDEVFTTYIVNGNRKRRYVETATWEGEYGHWSSPWDEYRVPGTRTEVIAWIPFPDPYRGE